MPHDLTIPRALHIAGPERARRKISSVTEQFHEVVDEHIDRIPAQANTNIILDVSDLVFYIGHHDNLTGIQRVQACLLLALFRAGANSSITCLSWDRVNARFLKLNNSYFVRLLKVITRPKSDRVIEFDIRAARMGILPECQLFRALPPQNEENMFVLLGAAWVNTDYFYEITKIKRQLRPGLSA
jgi:hypothetical protein